MSPPHAFAHSATKPPASRLFSTKYKQSSSLLRLTYTATYSLCRPYQSIYKNCKRAFSGFKQFIFVFHKCLFCPAFLAGFFYQLIHDFFLLLPFGKLHIDKAIRFSSHFWLCLDVSFLGSPAFLYKPKAFGSKPSSAFSLRRLSPSLFLISLSKLFPCLCLAGCWPFGSKFFGSTSLCRLLQVFSCSNSSTSDSSDA